MSGKAEEGRGRERVRGVCERVVRTEGGEGGRKAASSCAFSCSLSVTVKLLFSCLTAIDRYPSFVRIITC